eukprot:jgi/Botrbrau1/20970/Bobra.0858s0001.1
MPDTKLVWRGDHWNPYSSDGMDEKKKKEDSAESRDTGNTAEPRDEKVSEKLRQALGKLEGTTETVRGTREGPYGWLGPLYYLYLQGRSKLVAYMMKRAETDFDEADCLEGALDAYHMVFQLINEKDYETLGQMAAPRVLHALEPGPCFEESGLTYTAEVQPDVVAFLDWSVLVPPKFRDRLFGSTRRRGVEKREAAVEGEGEEGQQPGPSSERDWGEEKAGQQEADTPAEYLPRGIPASQYGGTLPRLLARASGPVHGDRSYSGFPPSLIQSVRLYGRLFGNAPRVRAC